MESGVSEATFVLRVE